MILYFVDMIINTKYLYDKIEDNIKNITPVIKIGKDGKNLIGHTTPYPIELLENTKTICTENTIILYQYLVSRKTLVWAIKNNYKCIRIEINEDYYHLAINSLKGV